MKKTKNGSSEAEAIKMMEKLGFVEKSNVIVKLIETRYPEDKELIDEVKWALRFLVCDYLNMYGLSSRIAFRMEQIDSSLNAIRSMVAESEELFK